MCALDLCLSLWISRRAILILLLINSIQIIGLKNLGEQVFLKSHSRNLRLKPNQQNVNRKQTDSIRYTQENHSKERYLMTNVVIVSLEPPEAFKINVRFFFPGHEKARQCRHAIKS